MIRKSFPLSWLIILALMIFSGLLSALIFHISWLPAVCIALTAWLAFENGGNDISKSVSTLISGEIMSYRGALISGSVATLIGGTFSAIIGRQMVKLFSSGLLNSEKLPDSVAFATLAGAIIWITIATRVSMPVSTTHSITGAIIGAGVLALGAGNIKWTALNSKIIMPLIASPVISIILAYIFWIAIKRLPSGKYLRFVHFLSAMFAAFSRAINDTPKIVALGYFFIAVGGTKTFDLTILFFIVAFSMAFGSYFKGLPVTKLLAEKLTKMDDREALGANFTTALLVSTASSLGLPVSTTHVASSAIIGFGLKKGAGRVSWSVVRDMVLSWIVTLPVSAIFAGLIFWCLSLAY